MGLILWVYGILDTHIYASPFDVFCCFQLLLLIVYVLGGQYLIQRVPPILHVRIELPYSVCIFHSIARNKALYPFG